MISAIGTARAGFLFCVALWLLWLAWLVRERMQHQRNLDALRLRIHVNGTRGKSSVTRLIAAGLRAGGIRTLAKVTGTEAKFIDPDGTERPVKRRGPANIREYLGTAGEAVACGAGALVCECMALQPELQTFCEQRLMRSHIGVITNVRHDHEEIMGRNLPEIAATLGRTTPVRGRLVATTETAALLRGAGVLTGREASLKLADSQGLSTEELDGFSFSVEPENVALALAVCELAGVARDQALAGMRTSQADGGNLTVREYRVADHVFRFVDALAANDPDSTRILWNRYVGDAAAAGVLLHARCDRRLRTRKLCELLAELHTGPYYLTGDTAFASHCLMKQGISAERLLLPRAARLDEVLRTAAEVLRWQGNGAQAAQTLFAAGNRKGFVV